MTEDLKEKAIKIIKEKISLICPNLAENITICIKCILFEGSEDLKNKLFELIKVIIEDTKNGSGNDDDSQPILKLSGGVAELMMELFTI